MESGQAVCKTFTTQPRELDKTHPPLETAILLGMFYKYMFHLDCKKRLDARPYLERLASQCGTQQ